MLCPVWAEFLLAACTALCTLRELARTRGAGRVSLAPTELTRDCLADKPSAGEAGALLLTGLRMDGTGATAHGEEENLSVHSVFLLVDECMHTVPCAVVTIFSTFLSLAIGRGIPCNQNTITELPTGH